MRHHEDEAMAGRIQLSRRRGWRKPADVVVVARPTRWGNPIDWRPIGKAEAVRQFREALFDGRLAVSVADVRRELAGRRLACWCKPGEPCHADVLLLVANSDA